LRTRLFCCSGLYPRRFGGRFSDYISSYAQGDVPAMTVPAMEETPEREKQYRNRGGSLPQ
jgi:hypothetical protein